MLNGLLTKLGLGSAPTPAPTDPAAIAEQERNAVFEFLTTVDHSLVLAETPRGATLTEDDDIISFAVEDDLSYTIIRTQNAEETDRRNGLTSEQMGASIAEMLHDHITGYSPAYHAERRARLGLPDKKPAV